TGAERVAVEKDHLTVRQAELLQLRHMSDISGEVRRMRSVKTAGELEKLHRAAAITDHTYEEVVRAIRVGQSELEVANMITAAMTSSTAPATGSGWRRMKIRASTRDPTRRSKRAWCAPSSPASTCRAGAASASRTTSWWSPTAPDCSRRRIARCG